MEHSADKFLISVLILNNGHNRVFKGAERYVPRK